MILQEEFADISTPTGKMRTYVYRPVAPGRYPGLIFFSEIYQRTDPIKRTAALLAGNGFVVAVPEIYHELLEAGTELAYNKEGTDIGNRHKTGKTVRAYDDDTKAVLQFLQSDKHCTGKLGAIGICIGGHLSYRASMNPEILASACFYATDIHKGSLGKGGDDSLAKTKDIQGEMLMIWGKQDPHIPAEGRSLIYQTMSKDGVNFTWHEFNAQHAFMRDEGHRYDPELALICYRMSLTLFERKLREGDISSIKTS